MKNKKSETEKIIEQLSKNLDLSGLKDLLDNTETNSIADSKENINYSFQNEIVNETAVSIDRIMIDVFKDVLKFITVNKITSVIELGYKFELKTFKDNVIIDMRYDD